MKGYKAFDKDLKCRDLQYKVGKTTSIKGDLKLCGNGLHFCEKLRSVFNYYPKEESTRVCEVEAVGEIKTEGDKSATTSLKIIRELSKEEIKSLTDSFRYNSGDLNSGNYNSGNYNSGNYNSGDRNSGNYNSGDRNSGMFNTDEPNVRLFNKETNLKRSQLPDLSFIYLNWKQHLVYVYSDSMTEQEKKDHPYHVTTGGFIRKDTDYSYKKSWERVWSIITDTQKETIKSLPNFCPKIFEEITGITVEDDRIEVTVNGTKKSISKKDAEKLGLI